MSKINKFEVWIKDNYVGVQMENPPDNWNSNKEIYYTIEGLYYGPILWEKIPTEFTEA